MPQARASFANALLPENRRAFPEDEDKEETQDEQDEEDKEL